MIVVASRESCSVKRIPCPTAARYVRSGHQSEGGTASPATLVPAKSTSNYRLFFCHSLCEEVSHRPRFCASQRELVAFKRVQEMEVSCFAVTLVSNPLAFSDAIRVGDEINSSVPTLLKLQSAAVRHLIFRKEQLQELKRDNYSFLEH